jgi:uncharacterized protein
MLSFGYLLFIKNKTKNMSKAFLKKYGTWAVVTGASDGIGRALAIELAKKGLNLFLIARRQQVLKEVEAEIKSVAKVEVKSLALDVGAPESSKKIFDAIDAHNIDCGLFAAVAGFGTSGNFIDCNIAHELNMLDVNCKAVVEQTHFFAKRFVSQKRGGIILMGSLVGFQGTPTAANYAASKAYVQSFAEGLHFELAQHHVDVLAVAPGPVFSGFSKRADMKMGSAAHPEDVARGIVRDLGHTITSRPGFLSKFLGWSLAFLPRYLRIRIMHSIMGGMTKHQHNANSVA